MDRKSILSLVLMVTGGVLATTFELRGADSRGLELTRPMVVAGVYLRSAIYDVRWEPQGARATVTFSRKGRAVATVQGELSTFARSVSSDTLYFSKQPDGFLTISALVFAKTNKGIVFSVSRSHPHSAKGIGNGLMENGRHNPAQGVPRIYR